MKKKHESSALISKATDELLVNFFAESMEIIADCKYLVKSIDDKRSGELDEDDLLDAIDTPLLVNISNVTMFRSCCFSIYNGINYYMKTIVEYVKNIQENLARFNSLGVYLTEEWEELLRSEASTVIGGLSHVLWYEFGVGDYYDSYNAGNEDPEVDEIFYTYCDSRGLKLITEAESIADNRKAFKFKLNFFDQYPEHEDLFESLMGPYVVGVDENVLTIEMVLKLENGDITPAELCESCEMLSNGTVDGLDVE